MLLIIAVAAISVVALVWVETRGPRRLAWLFKPLAASCFVALAIDSGALHSGYGQWLLAGLALSWLGDVLLIPDSENCFKAGLVSFLLGHVMYVVAFSHLPLVPLLLGIGLTLALALGALSWRWLQPHLALDMRIPVALYVTVICAMVTIATAVADSPLGYAVAIGGWGFALSDLAVARQQFVKPGASNRLWGTPLYFAAQLLLALTPLLLTN
ncbi:lysoplasmalogenase [Candidatus Litorirhabdus singularis]|nr:lysoplasmalogenase [Candidatus Litorirhabdus singularis]